MKVFLTAICIIVLIALIVLITMGFILSAYSMGIRRLSYKEVLNWMQTHGDISWFRQSDEKHFVVKSFDGYMLNVYMLVNEKISNKYVIISHGYTDNHYGNLKYAPIYLDMGFNVITYDLRGHGINDKTYCSYSVRESKDLEVIIKEIRKRYIDLEILGLHGESLGGATSIAVLKYHPQVDFVVDDCGFSEIKTVISGGLKKMHMPDWVIGLSSFCTKIRFGLFYGQMRPIDSLCDNQVPILFIHGEKDGFIKPYHATNMQKETAGYSELYMVPEAGHAESVFVGGEEYRKRITDFVEKIIEE